MARSVMVMMALVIFMKVYLRTQGEHHRRFYLNVLNLQNVVISVDKL